MKSLISVIVVLIGLLSFSKPMEAQSFQNQLVTFDLYYNGSTIDYDSYEVYARVVTYDGHNGDTAFVATILPSQLPGSVYISNSLPVWVPAPIHNNYYRIGVAIVGIDANGDPHELKKGASEWCNSSDLSGGLLIKL